MKTGDAALLKRAYIKIVELEQRLKSQEQSLNEPIAVIGMGCRFPGAASTPDSFWKNLLDGKDAINPIPSKRWNSQNFNNSNDNSSAEIYVDCGGFLSEDISGFDAHFFGISEREAKALDPQQRILLEVAWESLEHAGQNPDELAGTRTGVFLGIASSDYRHLIVHERNPADFNLYYLTGNAFSTASGRLSYLLGLNGPGVTIDTACSASLTAVHYACQSIWLNESSIALAGGVNLVLSPEDLLSYCNASMISPKGRCKSFDSSADGFILSEGCGIIVLKRLSDALINGDTIYAVIRSSSVNQDGASNGLTAPSSPAQEKLIRQALEKANLQASDIQYIEAHGSGTPLGDPIEVQALASVFGKRDKNNPLIIGCVKSNIGHCAAAAGIAGLIKTILCVHHKKIPRNLHFTNPNTLIPWNEITALVPTDTLDWDLEEGKRRRAGVSSFGVSGTNAHVIIEEFMPIELSSASRKWQLLPLSAKTESALNVMTDNLNVWIQSNTTTALADIAFTLQTGRKKFPFRRFVVCKDAFEAKTALGQCSKTAGSNTNFSGHSSKAIFVFPGQGSQYPGMGSTLYESEPVFRESFDKCAEGFKTHLGEDLRKIVFENGADIDTGKLKKTIYAQPAIFSIEYSLACLWQSWGVVPAALVGHSIGEFVAACVAGVMTFNDAVLLVARRSQLMNSLQPGTMISVRASEDAIIAMLPSGLSIAAVNSPLLCVVSGPVEIITAFQARCESVNIPCHPLHTSHAFHSEMVEPVLYDFKQYMDTISFSKPEYPIMSTVTGTWLSDDNARDPMYWTRHMRLTVRFSDAIRKLMDEFPQGLFLEVGPRMTSTTLIRQHFRPPVNHSAIPSMSSTGDPDHDLQQLVTAVGELWMHGISIDWKSFYRNEKRIRVSLPTYNYERKRFWIDNNGNIPASFYDRRRQPENNSDAIQQVQIPTASVSTEIIGDDTIFNKVRNLLATALGCSSINIDVTASFLHLGMDSLLMRQFSQQIKSVFGASVSVRQLMREYSNVQSLVSFIISNEQNEFVNT